MPNLSRQFSSNLEIHTDESTDFDKKLLMELTAQIVAAYVARNTISAAEVPQVIAIVRKALMAAGFDREAVANSRPPHAAVAIKSSIGRDAIACLICGLRHKMLKRHLKIAHGLVPSEYRRSFGLRTDYPMTAPSYAKRRSQLARQFGLGSRGRRKLR